MQTAQQPIFLNRCLPCLPTPLFPHLVLSPCGHQLVPKAGPGQRREQRWGLSRGGTLLSWKPGLCSWLFALPPPLRILNSTTSGSLQPRLPLPFKSPTTSSLFTSARPSRAPLLLLSSTTPARKCALEISWIAPSLLDLSFQQAPEWFRSPTRTRAVNRRLLSLVLSVLVSRGEREHHLHRPACVLGCACVRAVGCAWTLFPPAPASSSGITRGVCVCNPFRWIHHQAQTSQSRWEQLQTSLFCL